MRLRLEHVDPAQHVRNRYAIAVDESEEHWFAVIQYVNGGPGQLMYALPKSEYVVVPEKKIVVTSEKMFEDDGKDLI